MRTLTSKDGDLLSHCDKIDGSQAEINHPSVHHHLIKNHDLAVNNEKTKRYLPLELFFGFCRVNFAKLFLFVPRFLPNAQFAKNV